MAELGGINVRIGADTAGLDRGISAAERRLRQFQRAATVAGKAVAAGIAAATAAITALTVSSMRAVDEQSKLARQLGGTTAAVQGLERAAQLAGVSKQALTRATEMLNRRLGEAERRGMGPAADALERLGLRARDLIAMDVDERIATIADRMREAGYSTAQMADAMGELGIRNQQIIRLMQGGGDAIRSAREEVEAFGIAVSDVEARQIEQANDALTGIGATLRGIGNQIAVRLAPLIEGVASLFNEAAKEAGGFADEIDRAIGVALRMVGRLADEWRHTQETFLRIRLTYEQVIAAMGRGWNWLVEIIVSGTEMVRSAWNRLVGMIGMTPIPPIGDELAASLDRARSGMESAEARVEETQRRIAELLGQPLPSDNINRWVEEWRERSREAAEITRSAMAEIREIESEAGQQRGEELQRQLERLRDALRTEEEAELHSYATRLEQLADFHEAGLVGAREFAEMRRRIEEEHWHNMRAIQQRGIDDTIRAYEDMARQIGGVLGSLSRTFEAFGGRQNAAAKAFAVAQAIINTAQAITKTLAEYGATPWGLAQAAVAAAAGAAQIATIRRTSSRSSGGRAPSVTGGQPATGGAATGSGEGRTVNLVMRGLDPRSLYTGEAVRDLAESLIEYQRDGGRVVLVQP